MDFFGDIIKANQPKGTIDGISFGIVADVNDPLGLQRLQVLDMTKGGQSRSDWLFRLLPFTQYSPPVPKVGDLVVVGYVDGNPHKGCYIGVVVNNTNTPVGEPSDITIVLGGSKVTLTLDGSLTAKGLRLAHVEADIVTIKAVTEATIESAQITITAKDSLTIQTPQLTIEAPMCKLQGKDVAVVGARDSGNDTIITKGY